MKPEAVTAMTRAASAETVAACLRIEGTDFTAPEASRLMVKKTKLKTQAAEAAAGCADALDLIVKSYAVMPLAEATAKRGLMSGRHRGASFLKRHRQVRLRH